MTARAPPPPGRPTRAASSASTKARRPGRGGGRGEPPAAPGASSARCPRTGARLPPACRLALRAAARAAWVTRVAAARGVTAPELPQPLPAAPQFPRRARPSSFLGAARWGRGYAGPAPRVARPSPSPSPSAAPPPLAASHSISLGCSASSLSWGLLVSWLLCPPAPTSARCSTPPPQPAAPTPPTPLSVLPSSPPAPRAPPSSLPLHHLLGPRRETAREPGWAPPRPSAPGPPRRGRRAGRTAPHPGCRRGLPGADSWGPNNSRGRGRSPHCTHSQALDVWGPPLCPVGGGGELRPGSPEYPGWSSEGG